MSSVLYALSILLGAGTMALAVSISWRLLTSLPGIVIIAKLRWLNALVVAMILVLAFVAVVDIWFYGEFRGVLVSAITLVVVMVAARVTRDAWRAHQMISEERLAEAGDLACFFQRVIAGEAAARVCFLGGYEFKVELYRGKRAGEKLYTVTVQHVLPLAEILKAIDEQKSLPHHSGILRARVIDLCWGKNGPLFLA